MIIDTPFYLGNTQLTIFADFDQNKIKLYVYFPEDYTSEWRTAIKESDDIYDDETPMNESIAYLYMVWNKKNLNKYTNEKRIPSLNLESFSYLEYLYVYSSDYSSKFAKIVTPEERQSIKGIGKFLLCTAVSIGLEHKYLNINTPILLFAEGGYCRDPEKYRKTFPTFKEIVDYYKSFGTKEADELIEYMTEVYNRELSEDDIYILKKKKISEDELKELDLDNWRDYICRYEFNLLLQNYYNKTYGFEKLNEIKGFNNYMISTISNIAGVCGIL